MAISLVPKNLDNPEYLLPVCRNCTIKYHPIKPKGSTSPTWYFLGEAPGITEDVEGIPFVGDSGKLLHKMIAEAGFPEDEVRIFNSTICRPTDERGANRTPEPEESSNCFNTFAKSDIIKYNPKVIIAVGREAFLSMFPDMNRLSMKEMIQVTGLNFNGIPVRSIYHPSYINRTGGSTSSVYAPTVTLLKEIRGGVERIEEVKVVRERIICFPNQFKDHYKKFLAEPKVSLDYESSVDTPYDASFKLGMVGLANATTAIVVRVQDPDGVYEITEEFKSLLREILESCQVLVFNASFEMPTTLRFFNIDLAPKIHDLMQTGRSLNLSGGLKNICRLNINAPAWSKSLEEWTTTISTVSEYLYKKRKAQIGVVTFLNESKSIKATTDFCVKQLDEIVIVKDSDKDKKEKLNEIYLLLVSVSAIINAIPDIDESRKVFYDSYYAKLLSEKVLSKRFLLDYTDLPIEIVGPYNLDDTSYTYDLDTFMSKKLIEKKCSEAAELYDEHAKLEVELTSAGITWDDTKAEEILKIYNEKSLSTLKSLILHPLLIEQLKLTEPQKLEILSTTKEDVLLKVFNPRSSHKTTTQKFGTALLTREVKIPIILYLLKTDTDLLIKIKEDSNTASKYSTLLSFICEDEKTQLVKYKEFHDAVIAGTLTNPTPEELRIIKRASNYELEGINQETFEFFFSIFTKLIGVDANNKDTWTSEFYLLYYCRLFKKISKGRSAYIEGKCGRGQVRIVDRLTLQEDRLPLRLRNYEEGIKLLDNEVFILQPEYKVNDALTKRWKSFIHTIPWNSELREIHVSRFLKGILCHFDYSQMEVKILAKVSEDESLIKYLSKKGADIHRFVASKVWKKPMEEVTSAERRFAKTSVFAILYGKSIYAFATEIMNGDIQATEQLFEYIFTAFPGIKRYIDNKHKELLSSGEVRTMFGDTIIIPFDPSRASSVSSGKRQAQNYPIQSAASTVAGVSIYRVIKSLQESGLKARGFGFTHDSGDIDLECSSLIKLLKVLPELAEKAPLEKWGVPVSIDIGIGVNGNAIADLEDIEVESDLSGFKCKFEAHENVVDSLIKRLTDANLKAEVNNVKSELDYWDNKELFITRRAYSMYIGEARNKLKGDLIVKAC